MVTFITFLSIVLYLIVYVWFLEASITEEPGWERAAFKCLFWPIFLILLLVRGAWWYLRDWVQLAKDYKKDHHD